MPWTEEFQRLRDAMDEAEDRLHVRHSATVAAVAIMALVLGGLMLGLVSLVLSAD
jgi:hypothetical protein